MRLTKKSRDDLHASKTRNHFSEYIFFLTYVLSQILRDKVVHISLHEKRNYSINHSIIKSLVIPLPKTSVFVSFPIARVGHFSVLD